MTSSNPNRRFFDPDSTDPLTVDTTNGTEVKVSPSPPWFTTNAGICRIFTKEEWEIVKKERDANRLAAQKYVEKHCCVPKKRRMLNTCVTPSRARSSTVPVSTSGGGCANGVCSR